VHRQPSQQQRRLNNRDARGRLELDALGFGWGVKERYGHKMATFVLYSELISVNSAHSAPMNVRMTLWKYRTRHTILQIRPTANAF
jgi:hypothetical protein